MSYTIQPFFVLICIKGIFVQCVQERSYTSEILLHVCKAAIPISRGAERCYIVSMDAIFGLPRKKAAGESVREPLDGHIFL